MSIIFHWEIYVHFDKDLFVHHLLIYYKPKS